MKKRNVFKILLILFIVLLGFFILYKYESNKKIEEINYISFYYSTCWSANSYKIYNFLGRYYWEHNNKKGTLNKNDVKEFILVLSNYDFKTWDVTKDECLKDDSCDMWSIDGSSYDLKLNYNYFGSISVEGGVASTNESEKFARDISNFFSKLE